jgi:hypothetical protein
MMGTKNSFEIAFDLEVGIAFVVAAHCVKKNLERGLLSVWVFDDQNYRRYDGDRRG